MKRSQALRTVVTRSGLALVLLVAALLASAAPVPHASGAHLNVYYFDVDQGDATLLLGPDFTILIDAGRHDRSEVVDLLRRAGVQAIDLFVLTHPHSDHIGQCDKVMDAFPVREVWMSGDIHTSRTFERCIDAILASDAYYYEPRAGEAFTIGSAHIEVVHPARVTGDFNNGSVALRIRYGDMVFLFTGDAEADAEREMMARSHDLQATILHLGAPRLANIVHPCLSTCCKSRGGDLLGWPRQLLRTSPSGGRGASLIPRHRPVRHGHPRHGDGVDRRPGIQARDGTGSGGQAF